MTAVVVGLAAAAYEFVALASRGKLPTITRSVKQLPVPVWLAIVAVFAA